MRLLREHAYFLVPCAVIVLLALPVIGYLLPSCDSMLDDDSQPLTALKFFKEKGQSYHKYPPLPNLLLAPGYGVSIAYWWATGGFSSPSGDFPYGFGAPLRQLSALILQGRLLFLALNLALLCVFAAQLRRVIPERWAIFAAVLAGIATNYPAIYAMPNTRPDGLMASFIALSLIPYLSIFSSGLTPARGAILSIFAVLAISTKEMAGPVYVLPYLALAIWGYRASRASAAARANYWRSAGASLATGIGAYALLNVALQPGIWLVRMRHWLGGSGADSAAWGGLGFGDTNFFDLLGRAARCLIDNLGPGGSAIAIIALAALFARPTALALWMALPFASAMLGLLAMGYTADRFYTAAVICLVPMIAAGLARLGAWCVRGGARIACGAALALLLAANVHHAAFAWIDLPGRFDAASERHILEHVPPASRINIASLDPRVPNKSRLELVHGRPLDTRSLQEIADSRANLPEWIYISFGLREFIADCRHSPARAAMLRAEKGFDYERWVALDGLAGLGYERVANILPAVPSWYPYRGMPHVRVWQVEQRLEAWRLAAPR